jgi:dTDP-glucose 4,6-dehydratase
MPKTFIVTGGFGFIGSNLVNELLAKGRKVICFDKLTYAAKLEYVKERDNENFLFYQEDIADPTIFERFDWLDDIEGIFNLAAESHVDNSIANPYPFIDTNIKGTLNMLELARRLKTKIVQVSTDEVVGSIEEGEATEDFPLVTNSSYSASKGAAELFCRAYLATHNVNVVITRCGNNFGPNQHPEKFIPKIIRNALDNEQIPV